MRLTSLRSKIFLLIGLTLFLSAVAVLFITERNVTRTVITGEKLAVDNILNLLVRDSDGCHCELTAAGCDTLGRLVEARREHLAEVFAEWSPKKREEAAMLLRTLARELVPEAPAVSVPATIPPGTGG